MLADIIAKLILIPELVRDVDDDPKNIYSVDPASLADISIDNAISGMGCPQVMLVHRESRLGDRGDSKRWIHQFEMYIKALPKTGGLQTIFAHIVNGESGSCGVALQYEELTAWTDPMDDMVYTIDTDDKGVDYGVFTFTLAQTGDNS